jgi:hypothetical protein
MLGTCARSQRPCWTCWSRASARVAAVRARRGAPDARGCSARRSRFEPRGSRRCTPSADTPVRCVRRYWLTRSAGIGSWPSRSERPLPPACGRSRIGLDLWARIGLGTASLTGQAGRRRRVRAGGWCRHRPDRGKPGAVAATTCSGLPKPRPPGWPAPEPRPSSHQPFDFPAGRATRSGSMPRPEPPTWPVASGRAGRGCHRPVPVSC